MSSNTPKEWVKSYLQPIPATPYYLNLAKDLIQKKHLDKSSLSHIITHDPGLSSQLFNTINSKRKSSKRDYLESVQSALSLMGEASIIEFIQNMKSLDDTHSNSECVDDYLQLIARAHHAAKHSKLWASNRKSHGIKEVGIAAKLYDIAEYSLCLFDYENYKTYKKNNLTSLKQGENCKKIWGFGIQELSLELCDVLHLPDLVTEAHQSSDAVGIRTQGIKLAIKLAHQADIGWYQQEITDCLIKIADFCQIPIDNMNTLAHTTCVEAAHELDFKVKFHAAANLPRYTGTYRPAVKKVKENSSQETPEKQKDNLLAILKDTALNPKTTQLSQLNVLLSGCHQYLKTNRNILLLINQDRTNISTRLHKRLDSNSPLLKLSLNINQSGLLKTLLEKPQAIWVNPENFKRYEKMLPGLFKSCTLSDDFFMMSLFSGKKSLGIVYCDTQGLTSGLTKNQFALFKQAVSLTSKAMLLLNQRHRKT